MTDTIPTREERIEAYRARLERRYQSHIAAAQRAAEQAQALHEESRRMADIIPAGQPILIGHHSEGRDRNYRARIESKARRAIELSERAQELQARAESVAAGRVILSDDPEADEKIEARIATLQARQELMVAANKLVRKGDRAGLLALGLSEAEADKRLAGDFIGRKGFASWELQNNSANIRRLQDRLKALQVAAQTAHAEESIGPVRIITNPAINRTQIIFPDKPDHTCRAALKQSGFRWTPTEGAWQRHMSNAALYLARQIVTKFYAEGEQA